MIRINNTKHLKIAAVISYLVIIFNILAGLVYTPWMISQIGMSDYGLYILATSFLAYFVLDFGLGNSVARFIAKYRAENSEKKIQDFLGVTLKIYLAMDLVILIILIVIYGFIDQIFVELTFEEVGKIKILFAVVGLFSVFSFPFKPMNEILSAYEHFIALQICNLLNKILTITFVVLALLNGWGLFSLVFANIFSQIISIIIKLIIIKRKTTIKINFTYRDKSMSKSIFAFSSWTTANIILYQMLVAIQPTILGMFSGSDQIAVFSIGMTLFGYTNTFAGALSGLFLPKVSRIVVMDDVKEKIEELTIKVGRIQLMMIGLIVVLFTSMGKQFIDLWVGEAFVNSYYVGLLIIIPTIITSTQTIPRTMIVAQGKVKLEAYGLIGSALISIVASILLTEKIGAIGAGIGSSIGIISSYIIWMNIIYYKVLGINIWGFFVECHLKMSLPIILTLIMGFLAEKFVTSVNMLTYLIKVGVIASIYFLLMWEMSLKEYEKKMMIAPIKRMFNRT